MCGRYYIDDDTIREMEKLVRQIDKKLLEEKSRDVFPSQSAPVVTGRGRAVRGGAYVGISRI